MKEKVYIALNLLDAKGLAGEGSERNEEHVLADWRKRILVIE